MNDQASFPSKVLVLLALLQGLALFILHEAIERKFWPHSEPQWLFAFYAFTLIAPAMLMLAWENGKALTLTKWVLPFALLGSGFSYYMGYQAVPLAHVSFDSILFPLICTLSLATFLLLMHAQAAIHEQRLSYALLFLWSWRNFLSLGFSLLFALCVWGLLQLWAHLFEAIEIKFFKDLFEERWFFYPVLSMANGFGIVIFRRMSKIIDTITRLQQALMKFLLILIVFVSIIFLATLPYSGLAPLWKNGGSTLILWMQALILFFINAVYQDDAETRPYPLGLHRFIYLGVLLLPIYSAISFYGLSLRVEQYAWSLARCWAFLIWGLLALLSLSYVWGIAKYRDNWLRCLSPANIVLSLVLLVLMLAVNSPLLDFRKISTQSLVARAEADVDTLEKLDINYLRHQLGRPGYEALNKLKDKYADSHPHFALRIASLYEDKKAFAGEAMKKLFLASFGDLAHTLPEGLLDAVYEDEMKNHWRLQNTVSRRVLTVDMNEDSLEEYLFILESSRDYYNVEMYWLENDQWKHTWIEVLGDRSRLNSKDLSKMLNREFSVTKPRWNEISLDGLILRASNK